VISRMIISRDAAHLQGLKRFYTGTPCIHGHDSERFISSGGCCMCQNWHAHKTRKGPKAANVGWPPRGLIFTVPSTEEYPRVLPEEMEAAFLYMEAMRWHDYAVMELRKDPSLMAQYATPLDIKEQARLHAVLEKHQRVMERIRSQDEK
jgi:hypothetical protein